MSCSPSLDSNLDFREIWADAITSYQDRTKVDLSNKKSPLGALIDRCDSAESVLCSLLGLIQSKKNRAEIKWKHCLGTVIAVVLVFNEAAAELASSMGVPGGKTIFIAMGLLLKAANGTSKRLDEVEKLFFKFRGFFCRFNIHQKSRSYQVQNAPVFIEIFAEFLNVLGIALGIVESGIKAKAGQFWKSLMGNPDLVAALYHLDSLIAEELHLTALQTLNAVSHVDTVARQTYEEVHRGNMVAWEMFQMTDRKLSQLSQAMGKQANVFESMRAKTRAQSLNQLYLPENAETNRSYRHVTKDACGVDNRSDDNRVAQLLCMAFSWIITYPNPELAFKLSLINAFFFWLVPRLQKTVVIERIILVDLLGMDISVSLDRCKSYRELLVLVDELYNDPDHCGRQDRRFVQARQFALEDGSNSAIITPKMWTTFCRPGERFFMALIVRKAFRRSVICPRCGEVQNSELRPQYICPYCYRTFSVSSARQASMERFSPAQSVHKKSVREPRTTPESPREFEDATTKLADSDDQEWKAENKDQEMHAARDWEISEANNPESNENDFMAYPRLRLVVLWQSSSASPKSCLECKIQEKQSWSAYCSRPCAQVVEARGACLIEVPSRHEIFNKIEDQFRANWSQHTAVPAVRKIFKVSNLRTSLDAYNQYRNDVEYKGNFQSQGRSKGNERWMFHGTHRKCAIGETTVWFCAAIDCNLCNTLKMSFNLRRAGLHTAWGRFGKGMYTTALSSRANDYVRNGDMESSMKALTLAKVVVGRPYRLKGDNPELTAPPEGFDSVVGEKEGDLGFGELAVYNEAAVLPAYLILYERGSERKLGKPRL